MARILVGLATLTGDIKKVVDRFDLVEVRLSAGSWPKDATLKRWRKTAPPAFVFSVVLPPAVATLATDAEATEALADALHVAAILEARCILLQTPADVRPTTANKKRIAALFKNVPSEGTVRCWEPAGVWEAEDTVATARAAHVLPVLDAAQESLPPGPLAYTRLRALGKAAASARSGLHCSSSSATSGIMFGRTMMGPAWPPRAFATEVGRAPRTTAASFGSSTTTNASRRSRSAAESRSIVRALAAAFPRARSRV